MPEPTEVVVPQMNPNDEHAVLVKWHVVSGTRVAADQLLATMETTKATFDVNAPCDGYAFFREVERSMVPVGAAIAWISDTAEAPVVKQPQAAPAAAAATPDGESRITRKALRLMQEHGLSAADFAGLERVEVADVESRIKQGGARAAAAPSAAAAPQGMEPLEQSPSKMLEIARLAEVYSSAIPSTVTVVLSTERVAKRLAGGSVSLLELAIFEAARLLEDFPELNGWYGDGRAWHYPHASIGFAINLGRSLRVPVVRDAAQRSQLEISRTVRDLALRYMRNELSAEDVAGGTFTVTDLSLHDVVSFIPVLNHRQSAILGICAQRPGSGLSELVITFDHRMADGMRAAAFLGALRDQLEGEAAG
ncbi:MAG TPA: 2-oxo acid dehydrogenase subunit E2 [Steroidobacteraceae bacterium]|nr:2-oxo acid dehydrogenase subunit E2 [Steroidobacteraceae bacterium]